MDKTLHIPAFFDLSYKNSTYENISKEDILLLIRITIISYEESITFNSIIITNTTTTVITNIQTTRFQLIKL